MKAAKRWKEDSHIRAARLWRATSADAAEALAHISIAQRLDRRIPYIAIRIHGNLHDLIFFHPFRARTAIPDVSLQKNHLLSKEFFEPLWAQTSMTTEACKCKTAPNWHRSHPVGYQVGCEMEVVDRRRLVE